MLRLTRAGSQQAWDVLLLRTDDGMHLQVEAAAGCSVCGLQACACQARYTTGACRGWRHPLATC